MKNVKALSDEELVQLVRSSDQELYGEVVKRYQDKLMRYATNLVRDEDKAADIIQGAFIKAFINLKGFNTKKKFSSWIYRIVHNEAINFIKKHKKETSLEASEWTEKIIDDKENVERNFDRKEANKMISACLNELPFKYQEPLILYYLEEKTYEEISDVLRLPMGTVGTRINRGKKMMRVIFQKKGGEAYVKS